VNVDKQYFYENLFVSNPTVVYFIIQFILLAVYLSLAGSNLHQFNKSRKILAVVLFTLIIAINFVVFIFVVRGLFFLSSFDQYY